MRALVAASLFDAESVSTLDLVALFRMGAEGQHVVLPEPFEAKAFEAWKSRQAEDLREELDFAVEQSLEIESRQPPARQVLIDRVDTPTWDTTPVLPLRTALDLLRQPLVVLVENVHNDAAFLRCLADRFQRRELEKSEEKGWIRFDHGGGLPTMLTTLDSKKTNQAYRRRTWVLFDSDALAPCHPSKDSRELSRKCEQLGLAHYCLGRRAAENYLPPIALERAGDPNPDKKRKARAFGRLTPAQRSHFNMKNGLEGDSRRVEQLRKASSKKRREAADAHTELFAAVTGPDRKNLQAGFGSETSKLFATDVMLNNYGWLRDDMATDEMHPVIDKLLGER